MSWTCYSCGTKNPGSADQCTNCGGTTAAPRSFYLHWVFGGALFFLITYAIGSIVGATLLEFAAAPEESAVIAEAKVILAAKNIPFENLSTIKPDELAASKAAAIAKNKAKIPAVIRGMLLWILPALLFVLCGAVVGFISDGKTIIEAGLGSILGQVGGFFALKIGLGHDIGWLVLGAGLAIGFALAVVGSILGEKIQEMKERAV
ncbi:MAG: hypothetical protein MUC50_21580 [Myxococcota bacterium]|jgi:hypothetical protein|nr:hypothetical protein [Myxococcota bacterium]